VDEVFAPLEQNAERNVVPSEFTRYDLAGAAFAICRGGFEYEMFRSNREQNVALGLSI
jgi:hypothetical protein